MASRLTDKQKKDIIADYVETGSYNATAKRFGVALNTVKKICTQNADIAQKYGADVPFLRNSDLSSDTASTWDAMKYVLKQYEKLGEKYDTITVLQPTSPLRDAGDIKTAFAFFKNKDANMISSVCEMEHSSLWSNTLPPDLSMENFEDEKVAMIPRQQLPTYYRENGAIYIVRTEHLFREKNIYEKKCYAYIMNNLHSVDIDSELDFIIAKAILENYN